MSSKFKIGDRVKLISTISIFQANDQEGGTIITNSEIMENMLWYGMEFNRYISGHDCNGYGKMGHCAWVPETDLILVPRIFTVKQWKNAQG